ncbi:MAG: 50S ribosomal protein L11 methyltransferase [Gammaproteobacteria bacterium]|nr:50S ribosomal protein L11 methyltransferase [Gammaproteobacteria bacterium]
MPWQELTLRLAREQLEAAESLLLAAGAVSVTYRDAEDQPVLEPAPGETPLWEQVLVTGLFEDDADLATLTALIRAQLPALQALDTRQVEDQDWERAWMDDFRPMRFGRRLWICPSWEQPPAGDAISILLDPGLAFGTGTHPTTALCLEWLDAHPPAGLEVIDYGSGSGILAVAALKLDAARVTAVDIDPQALTATRDNAARNGVDDARLHVDYPEGLGGTTADLVMANILAGPLVELAPDMAGRVRPGGAIVLSGILREQAETVRQAYSAWFDMDPPAFREDWTRLTGRRRDD